MQRPTNDRSIVRGRVGGTPANKEGDANGVEGETSVQSWEERGEDAVTGRREKEGERTGG